MDAVTKKYTDAGWHCINAPCGGINDLVAQRDRRYHFVQVITDDNESSSRFKGLAQNSFIQNAFSNGATPVYAHVSKTGVKLTDVNTRGRVVIARRKTKMEPTCPLIPKTT